MFRGLTHVLIKLVIRQKDAINNLFWYSDSRPTSCVVEGGSANFLLAIRMSV